MVEAIKEITPEIPTEDTKESQEEIPAESPQESKGLVDSAIEAASRLEEANKKTEELIQRQEALYSRQMLGGRAEAGTKTRTPEDEAQEIANKIINRFK